MRTCSPPHPLPVAPVAVMAPRPAWDSALVLFAIAAAASIVSDVSPAIAAVVLFPALILFPGSAITRFLRPADRVAEAGMVVGTSLAVWTLGASAMAASGWWYPRLLAGSVMGLAVFVLSAGTTLRRHAWQGLRPVAQPDSSTRGSSTGDGNDDAPRLGPWGVPALLLPAALVLWVFAVASLDPASFGFAGLVSRLSLPYFVALLTVNVGFVVELAGQRRQSALTLYAATMLAMLHAASPLLYDTPRYAWTYKHLGVVEYLQQNGALDRSVDIYQNWPGLFAAGAVLSDLTGLAPLQYAGWAQLFFASAFFLGVYFLLASFTTDRRVVWLGAWLFMLFNWVGQDYFAPQPAALVMTLVLIGLALRWMPGSVPLEVSPSRVISSLVRREATHGSGNPQMVPKGVRRGAEALVYLCAGGVAVTHQLTPVVVVLVIVALSLAGFVAPRRVGIGVAAIAGFWIFTSWDYFASTSSIPSLSLRPFANAQTGDDVGQAVVESRVISLLTQAFSFSAWLLAAVGVVRRFRADRIQVAALLLVALPFALLLGNSYGGEAIYRVYLYSLPAVAFLAAIGLLPFEAPLRWPGTAVIGIVTSLAVVGFVVTHFGREQINYIRPGEVEAAQRLYDVAPEGTLVVSLAPNVPARLTGDYPSYVVPGGFADPYVLQLPEFQNRRLGLSDVDRLADIYLDHFPWAEAAYIIVGESQRWLVETYGFMPPGEAAAFGELLEASPRFELVYENEDAAVFRIRSREE